MAKSIKEMAKEYGEDNPNIVFSAEDVSDDTESPALDFEAGANAVLEEIEDFAESHFSDYLEPIQLMREKIKELKGE